MYLWQDNQALRLKSLYFNNRSTYIELWNDILNKIMQNMDTSFLISLTQKIVHIATSEFIEPFRYLHKLNSKEK